MKKYLYFSPKITLLFCILLNILLFETILAINKTSPSTVFAQSTGQNCSFVQANCSWSAVDGATSYSVKITEIETNTVIKNDTVAAPATKYVFPVTQGKTYQCDVSAVNSCGASGAVGTATALCEAQGLVASPTSAPTLAICGATCKTSSDCQSGLVCVISGSGTGYCAMPNLQQQCGANPSVSTCCVPPTQPPQPTVAATGATGSSISIGVGVGAMIIGGAFMILKSL